jgi:hypothetical protein
VNGRDALELRLSVDCTQAPNQYFIRGRYRLMAYGDRKSGRVDFERGIQVHIMGIDGTWRRDCTMVDVSQSGARLCIEGSLEGMDLKEFFLLLSSTGSAYRRCRMVRVAGDQIGIEFLKPATAKSKQRAGEKKLQ